jgi:hypothetical protein
MNPDTCSDPFSGPDGEMLSRDLTTFECHRIDTILFMSLLLGFYYTEVCKFLCVWYPVYTVSKCMYACIIVNLSYCTCYVQYVCVCVLNVTGLHVFVLLLTVPALALLLTESTNSKLETLISIQTRCITLLRVVMTARSISGTVERHLIHC